MKFNLIFIFLLFGLISCAQVKISNNIQIQSEEEEKAIQEVEEIAPAPVERERQYKAKAKKVSTPSAIQQKAVQVKQLKINLENQQVLDANQRSSRTPSFEIQQSKNQSVETLKQLDSNSFEYNFYRYESGNHDVSRKVNLKKAEKLQPSNVMVQEQLAGFNEIEGNTSERNQNIQNLVSEGKIDAQLLEYGHNVVQSCDQNSILVTHAIEDTYPVLLKSEDKNLEVISLELLQSEEYRNKLKNKGVKLPSRAIIDVQYFEEFSNLNKNKNIQYSLTIPKEYLKELEPPIYVQGLTIKNDASSQPENLNTNLKLLENRLVTRSILLPKSDKIKKINANYLPMLIQLRDYAKVHQPAKLEEIQLLIDAITSYNKQLKSKVNR